MASKKIFFVIFLVYLSKVESASLFERSYEYVMNIGKNLAPSFMTMLDCMGEEDAWGCAKTKAGILLDAWGQDLNKQRRSWQELADAEVRQSGRSYEELPSKLGREVEGGLNSLAEIVGEGVARAFTTRGHHESGGIDTITISTGADKKKEKKKKQKPPKIHLVQMPVMKMEEKGRQNEQHVQKWVIGKENAETRQVDVQQGEEIKTQDVEVPRGFVEDVWSIGEKALDSVAEHALESDNLENGLSDKSSLEEQRGKKKKKKKAILKLLLLGAVLKAKIGTMLQILSFKLQVKFFIIALLGLAINLARFWLDVKKSHHQQPQKVIYYEHAQHQHHYDEHEEAPGWGPWSRSMEPGEQQQQQDIEIDLDLHNTPYRAQERIHMRDMRPVPSDI
ncbi:uncharacterized protein LOC105381559 [Plutella xylostella]|uniref:uncharacterized protein LOC105381559 n=1 Tax=Plutella xylostella TaxID=51655 RepID=UPI00203221F2|nr:uncharacterized protein LOC105381559 [Plutella xylostella]